MKAFVPKSIPKNKIASIAPERSQKPNSQRHSLARPADQSSEIRNNRPEATSQRKLQEATDRRQQMQHIAQLQEMIDNNPRQVRQRNQIERHIGQTVQRTAGVEAEDELQMKAEPATVQRQPGFEEVDLLQGNFESVPRQGIADGEELLQGKFTTLEAATRFQADRTRAKNHAGMPDNPKAGIENLSGMSMDLEPVVQREVAIDRLNMVGENHDESDARRPRERGYTCRNLGANAGYWGEGDFALGDRTDFGDPKHLRIVELLDRTSRHFAPVQRATAAIGKSGAVTNENLRLLQGSLQVAYDTYFSRLRSEISENLSLIKAGRNQLGMPANEFAAWAKTGLRLRNQVNTQLQRIKQLTARSDDVVSFLEQLSKTSAAVVTFCDSSFQDVERGTITTQRSLEMDSAAERGAGIVGIWKIGQEHVNDIEIVYSENSPYHLVTRETFNTDLEDDLLWLQLESDVAVADLSPVCRTIVEEAGWDTWLSNCIAESDLGPESATRFEEQRRVLFHVLARVERAEAFPDQMYAKASRAAKRAMDSDSRYRKLRSNLAELTSADTPAAFIAKAAPIAADLRSRGLYLIAESAAQSTPSTGGGILSTLGLGGSLGMGPW